MDHDLFAAILSAFPVAAFAAVWAFVYSSAAAQPAVRSALTFGLYGARWARVVVAAYRRQAARRRAWRDLERKYAAAAPARDVARHRPAPGRPPAGQHARPVYADDGDTTVVTRAYPDARHVRQEAAAEILPVVTEGGRRIAVALARLDGDARRRRPRPRVLDDEDTVIVAHADWFGRDVAVGSAPVAA